MLVFLFNSIQFAMIFVYGYNRNLIYFVSLFVGTIIKVEHQHVLEMSYTAVVVTIYKAVYV